MTCAILLTWMSLDLTDDESTLVQVMAWCRQASSHYLNQCWPRPKPPYGVSRPQWVNNIFIDPNDNIQNGHFFRHIGSDHLMAWASTLHSGELGTELYDISHRLHDTGHLNRKMRDNSVIIDMMLILLSYFDRMQNSIKFFLAIVEWKLIQWPRNFSHSKVLSWNVKNFLVIG